MSVLKKCIFRLLNVTCINNQMCMVLQYICIFILICSCIGVHPHNFVYIHNAYVFVCVYNYIHICI